MKKLKKMIYKRENNAAVAANSEELNKMKNRVKSDRDAKTDSALPIYGQIFNFYAHSVLETA